MICPFKLRCSCSVSFTSALYTSCGSRNVMRTCLSLMTPEYTTLTPVSIDTIMVSQEGGVMRKKANYPPCIVCGKPTKRNGQRYCSTTCFGIGNTKDPYRFGACPICGNPIKQARDRVQGCGQTTAKEKRELIT